MARERVFFYGENDMACCSNMILAKKVIERLSENYEYDINDIIELYHIKLYIDNSIFLTKWSESEREAIKNKSSIIWNIIVRFWNTINNDNLIDLFNQLECWSLQDSFWQITTKLSIYKLFENKGFSNLLESEKCNISHILHNKSIVNYFSSTIKSYLLKSNNAAELLLSQYVEEHNKNWRDLYFPKCLDIKDREKIILNYIENGDTNLNYIRLILNIKKSDNLDISDKTRLKAKKLEQKLNNDILKNNQLISYNLNVIFSDNQKDPCVISKSIDNVETYSYSTQYFLKYASPIYYLNHFINPFSYLDEQLCIYMVNKENELSIFEKLNIKSKSEYCKGFFFSRKNSISYAQIHSFDIILAKNKNFSVEKIIGYYVTKYIYDFYGIKGFRFNLPTESTSYIEKIRILLAEFDALLKQYKLYKEENTIDDELFCMNSKPINYSQIPSLIAKKYCYLYNDSKLKHIMYFLFSDHSGLNHVELYKEQHYNNLYDLILKENLNFGVFKPHQQQKLSHIINEGFIFIDNDNILKITNRNRVFILEQLYTEEVLNYWHYSEECRQIIDEMIEDGELFFEDTLLNKLEQSYFNYFMNKKEFTNGIDLRNSYMHGTNSNSNEKSQYLYYVLLRIIVLTILKIDDDLNLWKKFIRL